MMNYLTAKITLSDMFAYNPEYALLYRMKKKFYTFLGGCVSIIYVVMMVSFCYLQVNVMLKFMNNSNSKNTTTADLKTIFKFSDLKSYPSY